MKYDPESPTPTGTGIQIKDLLREFGINRMVFYATVVM
jgi:hypothetical protein